MYSILAASGIQDLEGWNCLRFLSVRKILCYLSKRSYTIYFYKIKLTVSSPRKFNFKRWKFNFLGFPGRKESVLYITCLSRGVKRRGRWAGAERELPIFTPDLYGHTYRASINERESVAYKCIFISKTWQISRKCLIECKVFGTD